MPGGGRAVPPVVHPRTVFTIDTRLRGLPTSRDQVVALHQSINTPHLAIPGKQAGPAHAFVVGRRAGAARSVAIYFFLPEAADCAVYVSGRRSVSPAEYGGELEAALAFAESMGFMMDDTNFSTLAPAQQEELMRTLPVFQGEPGGALPPAGGGRAREDDKRTAASQLGRLLAAF
jgi:hypothetical protein